MTIKLLFQSALKRALENNKIVFVGSPKTGGYYAILQTAMPACSGVQAGIFVALEK